MAMLYSWVLVQDEPVILPMWNGVGMGIQAKVLSDFIA
jgi:hypothetical protein